MTSFSKNLDGLVLSVHAACLSEDGWGQVVGDLCQTFRARGAALVGPVCDPRSQPLVRLFEFDAAFLKQYLDYWAQHDLWHEGAIRSGRIGIGQVNLGDQLVDYRDYKQSAFFNEYLKPMDIDRMMNVCLNAPESGYGPTALSFYRSLGKEGFSEQETRWLSYLAPHLGVALRNYLTVRSMQLLDRVRAQALDAMTSAVFGLDASSHVAFTNRCADELLREGHWMRTCEGTLGPSRGLKEGQRLNAALRQLATGISFKLIVTEAATGHQAVVSGAPLGAAQAGSYLREVSSMVWLTPLVADVDVAAELARLYGLTSAEKRLLGALITRESLRDAAAHLQISLHTARTQLKAIFAKTGRRTQTALLSCAARLSSLRR